MGENGLAALAHDETRRRRNPVRDDIVDGLFRRRAIFTFGPGRAATCAQN
jgi:hypothetical protein